MNKILSEEEIAIYNRDGVLKPKFRIPPTDLAKLQDMAKRLVADNSHIKNMPFTHMHAPGYSAQKLKHGKDWYEMSVRPYLLDIVEDLIGPDIILWSSALFHKQAHTGGKVNFHRDAEQFPIEPLVTPNIWIALTPSTAENGCVRFVLGSHKSKDRGKHVIKQEDENNDKIMVALQLEDAASYESKAVPVELEPGEMYIADVFVVHGSLPNSSDIDRTGYSVRYFPSTSVYQQSSARADNEISGSAYTHFTNRPLFQVRGIDKSGKNDFKVGHDQLHTGSDVAD